MKRFGGDPAKILACGAAVLLASLLAVLPLEAQVQNAPARRAAAARQVQRLRLQQGLALRQAVPTFRGIGLTGEQRRQMRELLQQRRPQFRALAQKLVEARRGIRSARQMTPVDEAAVKQVREQAAKLRQDVAALRKQLRADALNVLTPEQQEKLKARAAQRISRRQ
jgi:Spy/CpxP family protein refolding chaperone